MGPCGHTNEVPYERSGEAGFQLSLSPVTHSVSLPPFGISYCLVLNCNEPKKSTGPGHVDELRQLPPKPGLRNSSLESSWMHVKNADF